MYLQQLEASFDLVVYSPVLGDNWLVIGQRNNVNRYLKWTFGDNQLIFIFAKTLLYSRVQSTDCMTFGCLGGPHWIITPGCEGIIIWLHNWPILSSETFSIRRLFPCFLQMIGLSWLNYVDITQRNKLTVVQWSIFNCYGWHPMKDVFIWARVINTRSLPDSKICRVFAHFIKTGWQSKMKKNNCKNC